MALRCAAVRVVTEARTTATHAARWSIVERCFAAALATEPERRDALIDETCGDADVRADVRRLLARHDTLSAPSSVATGFLDALDLDRAARLIESVAVDDEPRSIGRYDVVRRLGRGATGTVYLAHDPALDRPVAVKLLSAHLSADDVSARRFEQEARAASALDHPRIVTVYDVGRTRDDRLFIAMAYHAGSTLRERITAGPLPVDDAVRIAAEIGDGLGTAHERGIVHRDIKPENVLLTAHGACIVDFGIAKVAGQLLTRTGAALGTAAYMSPEQTRGEDVDARTDLWSLGVVLHEMLAGTRPFRADSGEALVYGVRHDTPATLTDVRADVPAAVARIVDRCLAKNATDRFPSARALCAALRAPHESMPTTARRRVARATLAAGGVVALAGVGALAMSRASSSHRALAPREAPTSIAPSEATIAVLPFVSLDADRSQAYLADGIHSDVARTLAASPHVRLMDAESVRQASAADTAMRAIGARLGATATLRATVQHTDAGVRVTTRLVRTSDGRELSAAAFPWRADDAAAIAADIRSSVLATLHVTSVAPATPAVASAIDPVAYDLYLRGRFAVDRRTPEGLASALVYFREAIARDSTFARARVGLANVYLAEQQAVPAERFRRAAPLVARALAQDSTLPEAHRAAGWIALWYDRDYVRAERELRRAIALDPNDMWGYHALAACLAVVGRTEESVAVTREATVLDPISAVSATHLGFHLFTRRRYAESIAVLEHALQADTTWQRAHVVLARSYLAVGRNEEAIALLRRTGYEYAAFEPTAMLAYGLGVGGHRIEARSMVDALEARGRAAYVRPVDMVAAHLGLGDSARALDWAERIPDDRGSMSFLLGDPLFDPIRETARFARVLDRMGLGEAARRMQEKERSGASAGSRR